MGDDGAVVSVLSASVQNGCRDEVKEIDVHLEVEGETVIVDTAATPSSEAIGYSIEKNGDARSCRVRINSLNPRETFAISLLTGKCRSKLLMEVRAPGVKAVMYEEVDGRIPRWFLVLLVCITVLALLALLCTMVALLKLVLSPGAQ